MASFVEELTWRGMVHDIMPETDATLAKGMTSGYIGFDTSFILGSSRSIVDKEDSK